MPGVLDVARAHQRQQVSLGRRIADQLAKLWRRVSRDDITRSWAVRVSEAMAEVTAGQLAAAASADRYVDDVLQAQDIDPAGDLLYPKAFAGTAADGRPLDTLLLEPAIRALTAIKNGAAPDEALTAGGLLLDMIGRGEIADAGRTAVGAALAARTASDGYVRVLELPSCARCAILAGRFYEWNKGFERHPRCDCRHVPTTRKRAGELTLDAGEYFDSLDAAQQDRIFTKAGAQAIRDGADIARVVNARRGMETTGTSATRVRSDGLVVNVRHKVQATRRVAGRDVFTTKEDAGRRARLMPEQIYLEAGDDREEARRLLRVHGYLAGQPRRQRMPAQQQPPAPAPAPPTPAAEIPLTREQLDQINARRELTFVEAKLRAATSATQRALLTDQQERLQERITRSGTKSGYTWNSPYWSQPSGDVQIIGTPTAERLTQHVEDVTAKGLPRPLRADIGDELRRQATVTPRTLLDLKAVNELSDFDHSNGQALAYYRPSRRDITYHPDWSSDRARLESDCARAVATGWWVRNSGLNGAASVTAHEFGHHVGERALRGATFDQIVALGEAFDRGLNAGGQLVGVVRQSGDFRQALSAWLAVPQNKAHAQVVVSTYSADSYHEMMAEVWCEYSIMGMQARPHIRAMGQALRDVTETNDVIRP